MTTGERDVVVPPRLVGVAGDRYPEETYEPESEALAGYTEAASSNPFSWLISKSDALLRHLSDLSNRFDSFNFNGEGRKGF